MLLFVLKHGTDSKESLAPDLTVCAPSGLASAPWGARVSGLVKQKSVRLDC